MANFSQPDNTEECFVQLFAGNERHLRAFVRSMGLDWGAVDDVMQTVSLVMWRKWDEFAPENGQKADSDFLKWGRVIARFEVLKFRRKMARDRHVFDEELMERLADAAEEEETDSRGESYRVALAECLKSLPTKSRKLIGMAYAGDQTLRELAEEIGKSATALYKSLDRIRKSLHHCIQTRIESTERPLS